MSGKAQAGILMFPGHPAINKACPLCQGCICDDDEIDIWEPKTAPEALWYWVHAACLTPEEFGGVD